MKLKLDKPTRMWALMSADSPNEVVVDCQGPALYTLLGKALWIASYGSDTVERVDVTVRRVKGKRDAR